MQLLSEIIRTLFRYEGSYTGDVLWNFPCNKTAKKITLGIDLKRIFLSSISLLGSLAEEMGVASSILLATIATTYGRSRNCFCASLLRTQFTSRCRAMSYIERPRYWRNVEIYSACGHFNIYARV